MVMAIAATDRSTGRVPKPHGQVVPNPEKRAWYLAMLTETERLIRKVCWTYANASHDQDDLFQEIALRLWNAADSYDPARKLSTWVYRVALNVAVDHWRRNRRKLPMALGLEADQHPSADEPPQASAQLQELRELMDRQPPADRALLMLYLDGNSHQEIGDILGISETNVGTRLSRLRQSMRASVAERSIIHRGSIE
jgi:RNA polymerase sigma-70 factor (ECF subfamily)